MGMDLREDVGLLNFREVAEGLIPGSEGIGVVGLDLWF